MAPRSSKKAKEKKVPPSDTPSSSSSTSWDRKRFSKKAAQKTFNNKIIRRALIHEREFPFVHRTDVNVYEALYNVYNGVELSKKREKGIIQVVQEYYANACHSRSRTCIVRGKEIHITVDTFRALFNLPVVENCRYAYLRDNPEEINWDAVAHLLTKPGRARWVMSKGVRKHIKRGDLNKATRFWEYFLASNVMPISHLSDITPERALLIYLLLQHEPVDLAVIMDDYLQQTIRKHRNGLVFPHFLSDICKSKGIKATAQDVVLNSKHAFNFNTLKGEDGDEGDDEQHEEGIEGSEVPEPALPEATQNHDELSKSVQLLHRKLDWVMESMQALAKRHRVALTPFVDDQSESSPTDD